MTDALERVVLVTPDVVAPSGHDQAMINLVDGKAAPAAAERPAWLPAKFANAEAMAASYAALEAKQGGAPVADPAVTPVVAPAAAPVTATPIEVAAAVKTAGLDLAALNTEFATSGALSTDSYTKLAAAGYDKAFVDNYVAGQQALQTQFQAEVTAQTPGGAGKYGEMVEWAKSNLNPEQIAAYNTAVTTGSKEQAKLAVAGLGVAFTAAVGSEPALQGGRVSQASADVYASLAQMQVDMKDKRYKSDPAFRATVQAKLGRSSIM